MSARLAIDQRMNVTISSNELGIFLYFTGHF